MKKSIFQSLIRIIRYSCMGILGQLLLVGVSYANDELIDVSGTVSSSIGENIPGVSILVKGTFTGTVTDIDGKYSLNVSNEDDVLVFSSIGYLTQEVPLNGRAVIDIIMAEDVQGLDEVVVVGYGTQKKVNVIGSVTTIGNEELTAAPVSTISNALAGRLPGAIVQQRSGEPGNDQAGILVRGSSTMGNNAPLIVIDGIPGRDLTHLAGFGVQTRNFYLISDLKPSFVCTSLQVNGFFALYLALNQFVVHSGYCILGIKSSTLLHVFQVFLT